MTYEEEVRPGLTLTSLITNFRVFNNTLVASPAVLPTQALDGLSSSFLDHSSFSIIIFQEKHGGVKTSHGSQVPSYLAFHEEELSPFPAASWDLVYSFAKIIGGG